jgi:hypothetical protein
MDPCEIFELKVMKYDVIRRQHVDRACVTCDDEDNALFETFLCSTNSNLRRRYVALSHESC